MDKIVSAYLYESGNKIIYELDVAKRQLRTLKDNVFKMEHDLRSKLRSEYQNTIRKNLIQIDATQRSFQDFKTDISTKIKSDILEEQNLIEKEIKRKALLYQQIDPDLTKKKDSEEGGFDTEKYWRAIDKAKEAQSAAIKELADLSELSRKNEDNLKMENVKIREKMQEKINLLKRQLTENKSLWQQLAEAEKREDILKQELIFTQQCLTKSEKANELLKDELKKIEAERLRLSKYKANTTSRLQDLEGKVKSLGVLGSIDLDKLLETLFRKKKPQGNSIPPVSRFKNLKQRPNLKPPSDLNTSLPITAQPLAPLTSKPSLSTSKAKDLSFQGPLSTKRSASKSKRLKFYKGNQLPDKRKLFG